MSRRVHTIAYIRLLTTHAYDIFIILPFSSFVFGLCFPNNLQFAGSVHPTRFAYAMLNLFNTFVTYFACDRHNSFFVWSQTMCIPRM